MTFADTTFAWCSCCCCFFLCVCGVISQLESISIFFVLLLLLFTLLVTSMASSIGHGNKSGSFYFGATGFLYKKQVGVGGRRSTVRGPGLSNSTASTYLYNKYSPGGSGIGASSIAVRRAKNRMATICDPHQPCFACYPSLGMYNRYVYNPN